MGFPLGPTFDNIFLSYLEFDSKIVLLNLNLSFIKDMLMTLSCYCYFDQKIIFKNFDVTLIASILVLSLHMR